MKKILIFCLAMIVFASNSKAQTNDCNGYFAYKTGTKLEIILYDKKDKLSTVIKYLVGKNTNVSGGSEVFFNAQTFDSKDKLLVMGDYSVLCKDGQVYADVRNVASDMFPKTADMEVDVTGDKLIYPHKLAKGQKLNDVDAQIKCGMKGGMTIMTIKMNLTNRVVEGFETVETPAGKFECVKITYDSDIKMPLMKRQGKTVEYLSKGIGVVKVESFDSKGKKYSSQMLTKLEK
jgi:hypothetical protein